MPADDLLSAITSGIADADPSSASSEDTSDEAEVEGGIEEIADTSAETTDETGDSVDEAAPEGEVKPDAPAQTPEEKAAAEAAAKGEAKPAEGAKKPDIINDPIPNALKPQTKERMQKLISTVKEKDQQLVQATAQFDEIMGHIQSTKATPQQYSDSLEYLSLVNSGEPAKLEKALSIMLKEVDVLARALGKPVPGVDLLADHKDLKDEIETGMISRERAMEIAAGRERSKIQTQRTTHIQQQNDANTRAQQDIDNGKAQLNALGERLQADPAYAAKRAVLVESLKPIFAEIHPSKWAATFEAAYNNLKIPTAAPRPTVKIPTNQPLRTKTPAGGGAQAPKSMLEAVSNSIAGAR